MKFIVRLLLLLLTTQSLGQAVDSIDIRVANTSSFQEKVDILNAASKSFTDANMKKSFDYATRAQKLAVSANYKAGEVNALLNMGKYNTRVGQHETAMSLYLDAARIASEIPDEKLVGLTYKIIGNGYYWRNDVGQALRYYKLALEINKKLNDPETAADLQNNIALVYTSNDNVDSALFYLNDAIPAYEKLGLAGKLANSLMNVGEVKKKVGRFEEAIVYYKRALDINRSKGLTLQEGYAMANIGTALTELKRYTEAEYYSQQAYSIAESQHFAVLLESVYEDLYVLHKRKGEYSRSLMYHEKWVSLKDSIFNEQKNKQIEELRTKYESEKKEQENEILTREARATSEQLGMTRLFLVFIVAFSIIVTILAVIYYRSLVKNRKAKEELLQLNRYIYEQKEEITSQAEELVEANQHIASINQNLEAAVREKTSQIVEQNERLINYAFHNAHRVRGPLARILGLTGLLKINAVRPEETSSILEQIVKEANELDGVVKEINQALQETRDSGEEKNL